MLWWQMKVGGRGKGRWLILEPLPWEWDKSGITAWKLTSCFSPFLSKWSVEVRRSPVCSSIAVHLLKTRSGFCRCLTWWVVFPSLWECYCKVNECLLLVGWLIFVPNWEISSVWVALHDRRRANRELLLCAEGLLVQWPGSAHGHSSGEKGTVGLSSLLQWAERCCAWLPSNSRYLLWYKKL